MFDAPRLFVIPCVLCFDLHGVFMCVCVFCVCVWFLSFKCWVYSRAHLLPSPAVCIDAHLSFPVCFCFRVLYVCDARNAKRKPPPNEHTRSLRPNLLTGSAVMRPAFGDETVCGNDRSNLARTIRLIQIKNTQSPPRETRLLSTPRVCVYNTHWSRALATTAISACRVVCRNVCSVWAFLARASSVITVRLVGFIVVRGTPSNGRLRVRAPPAKNISYIISVSLAQISVCVLCVYCIRYILHKWIAIGACQVVGLLNGQHILYTLSAFGARDL